MPRRIGQAVTALALAAWLAVLGYRTAHVRLPAAVRAALARGLGIERDAVTLGRVRLGPSGLVLGAVSAGTLTADEVRIRPHAAMLLGDLDATIELDRLRVEDPAIAGSPVELDQLTVEHARVSIDGPRRRVHLSRVAVRAATASLPSLVAAEVVAELDRAALRRLVFTSAGLGPLDQLSGAGHATPRGLELRAAGPGTLLSARFSGGHGELQLDLERRELRWDGTPALAALGMPSGALTTSGRVRVTRDAAAPTAVEAALEIAEGEVRAPRVAPEPIDLAQVVVTLSGKAGAAGAAAELQASRGAAHLHLAARLDGDDEDDDGTVRLEAGLEQVECAALLASLPSSLRRSLDGMALDGRISASLTAVLPLGEPAALALDGELDNRCQVRTEPPLADATRLRGSVARPHATDEAGRPRTFLLGPTNPSYRRLEQLPAEVVAVFIEAEDGRFWRHPGLDLGQLRRALAHDVEIGAPGRGGSTITQQVAKNLFLSGERTLGRKLEESVLAWRLERVLGKRRVLELYLNLVELGPGVYGVAEGARRYFDKDVAALTLDEAAQLAALLPAPRRGMDAAWTRRLQQLRARLPRRAAVPARVPPPG